MNKTEFTEDGRTDQVVLERLSNAIEMLTVNVKDIVGTFRLYTPVAIMTFVFATIAFGGFIGVVAYAILSR